MTSHWRLTLAAAPISWEGTGGPSGICLNASGSLFRITAQDLDAGGFHYDPLVSLKFADELDVPLRAVVLEDVARRLEHNVASDDGLEASAEIFVFVDSAGVHDDHDSTL